MHKPHYYLTLGYSRLFSALAASRAAGTDWKSALGLLLLVGGLGGHLR
jgi:hypothetical protein